MTLYARQATPDDISKIRDLEISIWGEEAASSENIESRIQIFPEGSSLVFEDNTLLAYAAAEIVGEEHVNPNGLTWDKATDFGSIVSSHDPSGEYVYGINLTARENAPEEASVLAVRWSQSICLRHEKKALVFGARVPEFADWLKKNPDGDANKYLELHISGRKRDWLLAYFEKLGFLPQQILPGYFRDKDSLDYGCLVSFENPLLNHTGLAKALIQSTEEIC